MARRKRVRWENGAVFAVPLIDGTYGIAQAIDHWMPHWIYVALFKIHSNTLPAEVPGLLKEDVVSLIAVSDDELNFGVLRKFSWEHFQLPAVKENGDSVAFKGAVAACV